ncbi:TIGR03089 family protein [Catellatospora sp. TT07R-123]|uniref:TIGR03089 family protein n=1 Tax=Catellatospora sp. TT07R-123 TaxID=2733863 RepID=UPI001B0838E1|nr:TIGR03089 family protein [Catellatospora sp. TT07R-123]GHJ43857.1 TIGR03089 family protein [Catellatospora sp. TT07R-123]
MQGSGAAALAATDAVGRPLLVYRDEATGERIELSAAELADGVARTASLLRDGCGLTAGDRIAVLLPPHWQTAAVVLGAWSIGVAVSYRSWATAGLDDRGGTEPLDAVFAARDRVGSWLETVPEARHRYVLGLGARDAALAEVPDGYLDYAAEVGRFAAHTPAYRSIAGTDPATPDGTTFQEWARLAGGIAHWLELRPGDRLLVDTARHADPVSWLLAPLAARATPVIVANLGPDAVDRIVAAEGVTRVP